MTDKRATTYTAEEIEAMAARYARSYGHADVAAMLYSLADQQEIIAEGKRQWDQVAALLGADGDNVDDTLREARRVSVPEGWQPIETLNEDIDFFACQLGSYNKMYLEIGGGYSFEGKVRAFNAFGESFEPTHWMELPEAPKREGE